MGNSNSISKEYLKEFKKHYSPYKSAKSIGLGDIKIHKSKQGETYVFQKQYLAKSEKDHQEFYDLLAKRTEIKHENLLRLLAFKSSLKGHSCTSLNKITIYAEYYQDTLQSEIQNRFHLNQFFPESDIWLILYQLIQAILFIESFSLNVDDIRPSMIFITKDGSIKLAVDKTINVGSRGAYYLAFNQRDQILFSPEQSSLLQQKEAQPIYNHSKSDIFSLGMTLLMTSSLTMIDQYYDFYSFQIKFQNVDETLNKMRLVYSQFLCNFLQSMIQMTPQQRPSIHEIMAFLLFILYSKAVLEPYSDDIKSGQPFEVNFDVIHNNMTFINQLSGGSLKIKIPNQSVLNLQTPIGQSIPQYPSSLILPVPYLGVSQVNQKNQLLNNSELLSKSQVLNKSQVVQQSKKSNN